MCPIRSIDSAAGKVCVRWSGTKIFYVSANIAHQMEKSTKVKKEKIQTKNMGLILVQMKWFQFDFFFFCFFGFWSWKLRPQRRSNWPGGMYSITRLRSADHARARARVWVNERKSGSIYGWIYLIASNYAHAHAAQTGCAEWKKQQTILCRIH